MRFKNNTLNKEISLAIKIAESLLNPNSPMIKELLKKDDFKFNSGSGSEVVLRLLAQREVINVFTYRSKLPWSKALGYFDGKAIYINVRKLPGLDLIELASLILHEYAHYCGMNHGNNFKTQEKALFSVPYFISENVHRWINHETESVVA